MSKKENAIRRTIKMLCLMLIAGITFGVVMFAPIFQNVRCEIRPNQVVVHHTNKHIRAINVVAKKVDSNGNEKNISIKLPLNGNTEYYTFETETIKDLAGTDDEITVTNVDNNILYFISNLTTIAAIIHVIFMLIFILSAGMFCYHMVCLSSN